MEDSLVRISVGAVLAVFTLSVCVVAIIGLARQRILKEEIKRALLRSDAEKKLRTEMLRVQEEERERIARDLHDEIGAQLAGIHLASLITDNSTVDVSTELKQLGVRVREIAHAMYPATLARNGLSNALAELVEKYRNDTRSVQLKLDPHVSVSPAEALNVYRVVAELLSNSVRHGNATRITIEILPKEGEGLSFRYSDNGVGFEPGNQQSTGHGLQNIGVRLQSLNATYGIESSPGKGFLLTAQLHV